MELWNIKNVLSNIKNKSTIIITSSSKDAPSFELEKINNNKYKLYISESVENIEHIFNQNDKINNIIFENWNSKNLKNMNFSFGGLVLDDIPDFSNQDFSNLEYMEHMFADTVINDKGMFCNYTFKNLKSIQGMFFNFKCNNLLVSLGKTSLEKASFMFSKANCNNILVKIDETGEDFDFSYSFMDSNINNINIKELNISNCNDLEGTLETIYYVGTIVMPETFPSVIKILDDEIANIDKIYCNRKWADLLEHKVRL